MNVKLPHLFTLIALIMALPYAIFAVDTLWMPVDIPMRDGKTLAGDFYTLDSTVAKPVILIQTPYNKATYRYASFFADTSDTSGLWNFQHYHFMILDWRGFFASTPADSAGYDRGLDGYDAVEWIASRPWCDGNVGTYGGSALGDIQFRTARHKPPHLICCVPFIKDFKTKYTDYYYGGVYREQHVNTLISLGFYGAGVVLEHPRYNYVWEYIETNSDYPEEFEVPMLMATGWFDHYPNDCLRAFNDIRERSHPSVRGQHRMIIGPWSHGEVDKLVQGDLEFPEAVGYFDEMVKLFFDYYLRGADNGLPATPPLQFFQMGENIWLSTEDWIGLGDTSDTLYFQQSGGLSRGIPTSPSGYDSLIYDPRDPSPSYGGACFDPFDPTVVLGPVDISDVVESRDDLISYSTEILSEPLRIVGQSKLELYISSNRLDTDFALRLCDVHPDGRSIILTDGIRRARFRNGFTTDFLMSPGTIYMIPIEIHDLAHTFLPGHRLRIVVTSSNHPRFDRNLNNGGEMYVEGDTLIATNRVYTNSALPSRFIFTYSSSLNICDSYIAPEKPMQIALSAYPNPFNSAVRIEVESGEWRVESLEIFDIVGRRVGELIPPGPPFTRGEEEKSALSKGDLGGFLWQPDESLPSGVYLVRAQSSGGNAAVKIVYLK